MKKKRMKIVDVYELESHYYDTYEVSDRNGEEGIAFVFNSISDTDRKELEQYSNIVISEGVNKYAPEIKNYRLIIKR